MKTALKYLLAVLAIAFTFASCSSDDKNNNIPVNEMDGLLKIQEFDNALHTIELYSITGFLEQGYNEVHVRIKEKTSSNYIKNAIITWKPVMHMAMMSHGCPHSELSRVDAMSTLYNGYIVFTMPQNNTEYWDLEINYKINEESYTAKILIDVLASIKRNLNSFTGTDGSKYIMALVEPNRPQVALNDLKIGIWKMEDMMNFPMVNGYSVKIDPRMPSMGNHTSPNNVNALQSNFGELYNGKLSLTMTGYWKINLQLVNVNGEIVKGEKITESNEASSIFFEIEF